MLNIGDKFRVKRESIYNGCHKGEIVVIEDIDEYGESYLVQDARNDDWFCCLQTVPFEDAELVAEEEEK